MEYNGSLIRRFDWANRSGLYAVTTTEEMEKPGDDKRVKIGFARGNGYSKGLAQRLSSYSTCFPSDEQAIGQGVRVLMIITSESGGNTDTGDAALVLESESKAWLKAQGINPFLHRSSRESEWVKLSDVDILKELIKHLLKRTEKGFNARTGGRKPAIRDAYYFDEIFDMPDTGSAGIEAFRIKGPDMGDAYEGPVQLDQAQERTLRRLMNAYTRDKSDANKDDLESFLLEVYGETIYADKFIEKYKNTPLPTNPTHEERSHEFADFVEPTFSQDEFDQYRATRTRHHSKAQVERLIDRDRRQKKMASDAARVRQFELEEMRRSYNRDVVDQAVQTDNTNTLASRIGNFFGIF